MAHNETEWHRKTCRTRSINRLSPRRRCPESVPQLPQRNSRPVPFGSRVPNPSQRRRIVPRIGAFPRKGVSGARLRWVGSVWKHSSFALAIIHMGVPKGAPPPLRGLGCPQNLGRAGGKETAPQARAMRHSRTCRRPAHRATRRAPKVPLLYNASSVTARRINPGRLPIPA